MKRPTIIGAAIAALGLAACGSTATPTARPATPTPTVAPTTAPSTTPAPLQPLALLSNSVNTNMEVVSAQGVVQWGLTAAQQEQMVGETAQDVLTHGQDVGPQTAGPNILEFYSPGWNPTVPSVVVVLDRTGKIIGRGTAPTGAAIVGSPNGTEWASNVDHGDNAQGQAYGTVEVSGIGEATRTIFNWVAPKGFTEGLTAWTDAGLILLRAGFGTGCNPAYAPGSASFIINPETGAISNLFSGNQEYVADDNGVQVAALLNDAHSAVINGVAYPESQLLVIGATISPDGAHVAVNRASQFAGCSGTPSNESMAVVSLAGKTHIDVANLNAASWWNDSDLVATATNQSAWLYTAQGQPVTKIAAAPWTFSGVLPGSS